MWGGGEVAVNGHLLQTTDKNFVCTCASYICGKRSGVVEVKDPYYHQHPTSAHTYSTETVPYFSVLILNTILRLQQPSPKTVLTLEF